MQIRDKINWILKYCSEHPGHEFMYDERLSDANLFNIDLGVEDYILKSIDNVHLVLLTGDAGDGKSRVLYNLRDKLDESWVYINDFSELNEDSQKSCIEDIYKAINKKDKKYIIAANSGIFINSVVQSKYDLLNKLKSKQSCLVINFKNRNLAESYEKFSIIVKQFLKYDGFGKCTECELCENCVFVNNLRSLNDEKVIEGVRVIFDSLFLMGIHITFRDLLSCISYFVTNGKDCEELKREVDKEKLNFYNNIFNYDGNTNLLLLNLKYLDISKKDIEEFDYKIFNEDYHDEELEIDIGKYSKLEKLKILKRYYYFIKPEKLIGHNSLLYDLLPTEFLLEYKILIDKIKKKEYIDSMDCNDVNLRKIELGLNKISNPNHSNAQLVLFDSPPITSKDVRLEYSSGDQLRLIFSTPRFYFTNGDIGKGEIVGLEDLNVFYCFVYYEEETFENCPVIKIDYNLFNQIMMAEKGIFTDKNAKLSDNVHVQSFTKAIFNNINTNYSVKVTWTGSKDNNIIDFNMSFLKPTGLGRNKEKLNKVLISSIGR